MKTTEKEIGGLIFTTAHQTSTTRVSSFDGVAHVAVQWKNGGETCFGWLPETLWDAVPYITKPEVMTGNGGTGTPTAWANTKRLRSAVRTLNEQHRTTSAGFYGLGSRFFRARARAGVLEVFDFETWTAVPESQAQFHDHNGHDIPLD